MEAKRGGGIKQITITEREHEINLEKKRKRVRFCRESKQK